VRPSEEEAIALHRKHGSSDSMVAHCRMVAAVARVLAEEYSRRGPQVDVDAVVLGALLHDIGRTRTQTVRHGVEGAELLRQEGVDVVVVEIVKRHVGAGISPEEAERLGFPRDDYIPRSLDQRIVCFADKLVDSDRVRPFEEEVRRFTLKSHDVGRLRALKKQLQDELGEDPEAFVFNKIKESH
jgi:uncharacterized protein